MQLVVEGAARCLSEEGIDDDGDEEVEEHLTDDDLEEQMESDGESRATALRTQGVLRVAPFRYHLLVALILNALVGDRVQL